MDSIDDSRTVSLADVRAILSRRKFQLLVTYALVFGGVAAATFLMPKQYDTRMKILVKNERADMVVSAGSNAGSSFQGEVSEAQINTEIELLNNNDLLRQVVTKCGLEQLESSKGTASGERHQVAVEMAIRRLQHGLRISPVRKADIIEVEYSANDPRQAAAVLRQLAESYLEAHLRVHSTPGTYEFFLGQAAHYQSELKNTDTRLTEFRRQNDIVMFDQQKEDLLRKASDSRSSLLATEATIREYTRKIADARSQLAATEPRIVTQNRVMSNQYTVEHLSTMLAELQNRRTQLFAKFRPEDRLVQEATQEIADTQIALDKAKNITGSDQATDINPVRQALEMDMAKEQAELAGFEARRQALVQQAESYRAQLARLGDSTIDHDDLVRNQKTAEENYLLYTRKTEEARIADSLDKQKIANVAIAENPAEPHLPAKPNVRLNLAVGALLAGFLSLGMAFGAEYLQQPLPRLETDPRISMNASAGAQPALGMIEQSAELEALTGLPVFAVNGHA